MNKYTTVLMDKETYQLLQEIKDQTHETKKAIVDRLVRTEYMDKVVMKVKKG